MVNKKLMENQPITKEEAKKLMENPCLTRGEEVCGVALYVEEKYGKGSQEKMETKLKEWGYPIIFQEIRFTDWHPEGLNALALLAAKEVFNWTEADIFTSGQQEPKISLGAKVYIKYFLSLQKTFNAVPQYWKKFETCGELELYKLNEKEKYLVMRLKNYDIHPIMCPYLGGYFLGLAQNIIRSDKITIEETACIYKGGAYHEYTIRWQ